MSVRPPAQPFTVLLVCTGNICRSAFAEQLGRAFLADRLGSSASMVKLVSAGTRAVVGSAMHPSTAVILESFGVLPSDFIARQLDEHIAAAADLTLTMTRAHRQTVLEVAPRALRRTFTLREAADLLGLVGSDPHGPGQDILERARQLVARMSSARPRRQSREDEDDVVDPMGQPMEVHEQVGMMVVASLLPVLDGIARLHGEVASARTPDRPRRDAAVRTEHPD